MRSMTGFGRSGSAGEPAYFVEVRAVNHRHLDLKTRLPHELIGLEPALRAAVAARIRRGRIDLNVFGGGGSGDAPIASEVVVNEALARSLLEAHRRVASDLGVALVVDSRALLSFPGVVTPKLITEAKPDTAQAVLLAVTHALDGLVQMREVEGAALSLELLRRLASVESLCAQISERAPEQALVYRQRLEARLKELLATIGVGSDPSRILHEVASFAERVDIAEELSRLNSHIAQTRALVTGAAAAAEDGIGRRLDFLCQEMFREANTVGSKVSDLTLSECVVEVKAELERLREQVQNVE